MSGEADWSSDNEDCQTLTVPLNAVIDNRYHATVTDAASVWKDGTALHRQAAEVIHKVWTDKEWVSRYKPAQFVPLDSPVLTTPIPWKPPPTGICLLELFGGIATGLAATLQAGIKVRRYMYVDIDPVARQVARAHIRTLRKQYPNLLPREATRFCFTALADDVRLIDIEQLRLLGQVDLVIAGWPCQGMSMAGHQNGLRDRMTALFGEMIRIIRTLQLLQTIGPGYLVENVPMMEKSRARSLAGLERITAVLGPSVSIDAAQIGSRAHRYRQWWTNLIPTEVLQAAYKHTLRPPNLLVQDILDPNRQPRQVRWDDKSPYALVNRLGEPREAFPTFLSFARSYAFCGDGPGTLVDTSTTDYTTDEPNADERERAMGFATGTTQVPRTPISEMQRRALLGQAMDLNCVTWLLAIAIAEQRHVDAQYEPVLSHYALPLAWSSYLTSGTNVKIAGGVRPMKHPWHSWEKDYRHSHQRAKQIAGFGTELRDKPLMEFVEELFYNRNPEPDDWRGYVHDRRILLGMVGAAGEAVSVGIT